MSTLRLAGALVLAAFLGASPAIGQKATEIYIPIGRSPGLSGQVTVLGTIEAVEPERGVLTISGPGGTRSATVTERTRIWLDRSKAARPNTVGALSDCRLGRTAEIKYEDPLRGEFAEWVKVGVE